MTAAKPLSLLVTEQHEAPKVTRSIDLQTLFQSEGKWYRLLFDSDSLSITQRESGEEVGRIDLNYESLERIVQEFAHFKQLRSFSNPDQEKGAE